MLLLVTGIQWDHYTSALFGPFLEKHLCRGTKPDLWAELPTWPAHPSAMPVLAPRLHISPPFTKQLCNLAMAAR